MTIKQMLLRSESNEVNSNNPQKFYKKLHWLVKRLLYSIIWIKHDFNTKTCWILQFFSFNFVFRTVLIFYNHVVNLIYTRAVFIDYRFYNPYNRVAGSVCVCARNDLANHWNNKVPYYRVASLLQCNTKSTTILKASRGVAASIL